MKSGSRFEGEWKNDNMHGKGTYHSENGDHYKGEFKDDTMHGKGTFHFANGDRYTGEWKYDNIHGKGTLHYASGDRYEGKWKKGNMQGKGMTLLLHRRHRFLPRLRHRDTLTSKHDITPKYNAPVTMPRAVGHSAPKAAASRRPQVREARLTFSSLLASASSGAGCRGSIEELKTSCWKSGGFQAFSTASKPGATCSRRSW